MATASERMPGKEHLLSGSFTEAPSGPMIRDTASPGNEILRGDVPDTAAVASEVLAYTAKFV